jgi:hypothetical protein
MRSPRRKEEENQATGFQGHLSMGNGLRIPRTTFKTFLQCGRADSVSRFICFCCATYWRSPAESHDWFETISFPRGWWIVASTSMSIASLWSPTVLLVRAPRTIWMIQATIVIGRKYKRETKFVYQSITSSWYIVMLYGRVHRKMRAIQNGHGQSSWTLELLKAETRKIFPWKTTSPSS